MGSLIQGDVHVRGTVTANAITIPTGSITDASIAGGAGIAASKLEHQFPVRYQTVAGAAVATATHPVHVVQGATGTVVGLRVASVTAPTSSDTVVVDLQKSTGGGAFASVLTGTVTLDSSSVNRTAYSGTIASPSLVAGDILQVVVTVSGTTCQGLVVVATLAEDAS